ncbi:sensor histidine kinase [Paenibacillus psychroresistens]|uniref:Sensor histidine kinase n=1 Tax=Paenibacillus psychroresistens TaxID=1778678 RepID=A0A6B8RF87_9BACL|nr:histidine kinase [Paenibacillus psychroresistens]QGQ95151.1 sensor histidine kinase [Paenibacillus psychroresistens]
MNKKRIFFKFLLFIILLVVIPYIIMNFVVYRQLNGALESEISETTHGSLMRIKDVVDNVIEQADLISRTLYVNSDMRLLSASFNSSDLSNQIIYYRNTIQRLLYSFTSVYTYIDSIEIYSQSNQMALTSKKDIGSMHNCCLDEKKDTVVRSSQSMLSIVRYFPQLGTVTVNIDLNKLGEMIGRTKAQSLESLYIMDETNTVMYSEDPQYLLPLMKESSLFQRAFVKNTLMQSIHFDGNVYTMASITSDRYNWKYISFLPPQQQEKSNLGLRQFSFNLLIFTALSLLIIAVLISIRTLSPLKQILTLIENPDIWQFRYKTKKQPKMNELKYITSTLLRTIQSNKQLELKINERFILLNQARINALRSQINPHFLYNTLETVNWMAISSTNGKNQLSSLITNLSDLLRQSAAFSSELIPLEQEIDNAKKYADLLINRFEGLIEMHWNIPVALSTYRIIQICLQPLIENAIFHGIIPRKQKSVIHIEGREVKEGLLVEVIDQGIGMSVLKLQQLKETLNNSFENLESYSGLQNVNRRIQMMYGDGYGIHIESKPETGTTASILVPIMSI